MKNTHDHSADDALAPGHRRSLHLPTLFPAHPPLQHFLDKLFLVMTNTQPCADPDYGHNHLPLVHLASIFARPISIDTSIPLTSVTTPAAALPGGSDSYYLPGSNTVGATNTTVAGAATDAPPPLSPTLPSSSSSATSPPVAEADAATMLSSSPSSVAIEVPGVVRQRYQLLPDDASAAASIVHAASVSAPGTAATATATATASTAGPTAAVPSNGTSDTTPHRIFGTRTITLLVHLSALYVRTQQPLSSSAPPAPPAPSADASVSLPAVDRGYFVLIEDDLRMLPPSTTATIDNDHVTPAAWTQQHVFHSFDNLAAL